MEQADLDLIIDLHRKYLRGEPEGKRANLRGADLRGVNLGWATLGWADLKGTILEAGKAPAGEIEQP